MNLVIVESPTKAKTIAKFLSKDFKIESSFGHVRDLPEKKLGVDVKNNFEPTYVISPRAKKRVTELKKLAEKANLIYFATDEDREGEAISWHLAQIFNTPINQSQRITFHEITEEAIKEAIKNPRTIDLNLVDAQQARRILDRLVGYELSPFLWKKITRGLSAGRVQSVAVRLIVEREREIQNFKIEEYWEIVGQFRGQKNQEKFSAKLQKINNQTLDKLAIASEAEAKDLEKKLLQQEYYLAKISKKENKKHPLPPFTTSTLQQEANRRLGYSAKQTMMIAQQLYEGVEIAGEATGLITYMRTDSLNLSQKFLAEAGQYIQNNFGDKYLDTKNFKTKSKGAQEAHEAIRPTNAGRTPESIKSSLDNKQFKLYQLIWQRALASQMSPATVENTSLDVNSKNNIYTFRTTGQIIKFDGFLKLYNTSKEEILPNLSEKEAIECLKIEPQQKFTQPPARYSDATLVKAMEEKGIGRPSTYAPTIATIISRGYVQRDENKRLEPQEIAGLVNDMLVKHFPQIVDYDFTAKMEDDLDEIAEGEKKWQPVIKDFYEPFEKNLKAKEKELTKKDLTEEKSNEVCEKCGSPMVIKFGRYGKFLACSNYPDCKNVKKLGSQGKAQKAEPELLAEKCPDCGSPLALRKSRYGAFKGCSNYPKCKYIKKEAAADLNLDCPKCQTGKITTKRSRKGIFYGCNRYPECDAAFWGKPTGDKCTDCGWPMVETKTGVKCGNRECR